MDAPAGIEHSIDRAALSTGLAVAAPANHSKRRPNAVGTMLVWFQPSRLLSGLRSSSRQLSTADETCALAYSMFEAMPSLMIGQVLSKEPAVPLRSAWLLRSALVVPCQLHCEPT